MGFVSSIAFGFPVYLPHDPQLANDRVMSDTYSILVVDDSLTQRAIISDQLQEAGFSVETAGNGMEAMARVAQAHPSLILSDVMMPELNGYHLCRLLKNDPVTAHIPIILLTNLKERHDRFWGETAGADRYLEKGTDFTPVLEAIRSLLPLARPVRPEDEVLPCHQADAKDIRAKVTEILDRLLYESTISTEILKLTGLTHDTPLLAKQLVKFLSAICSYSAAGLLLKDGHEKYLLCFHLLEPVSQTFLEQAKADMLRLAGLTNLPSSQVPVFFLQEEFAAEPPVDEDYFITKAIPLCENELPLASIALFDRTERCLSDGTHHALQTVADRFMIVASYLNKFKEIEEVKADFVSMLVHDLRAPLTGISGFTDVLIEGSLGTINAGQTEALDNIKKGCQQLLHLIEGILEFSKLEAGKMHIDFTPLHIRPLAERVYANLSPLFAEKNLSFHLQIADDVPFISADEKQLSRVLVNLLTNAIKFTPPGGEICLHASQPATCPTNRLPNCLQVSLTDTGVGIPPQLQEKLFSRYHQVPSTMMFRKGTGLGLAICKEIIRLHGGEIWVESPVDPQGGSRFIFTLPLMAP